MRIRLAGLAAVVFAASVQAQAPEKKSDVLGLAWLEGHWAGTSDGIAMEESWLPPRGGALLGVHRDIKDGRMVSFEFLRIESTSEGIVYFASPRSVPPTPFRMVELGEGRVVFENKAHDFPQRILYWLDSAGSLHARIEGPQGGRTVGEEWTWAKTR